jgi:phosphonate transport system ATP-binding protein
MIVFDHVDKVYPSGVKGLTDINLTINDGEFVCIIGLSGAGKSTFLRTINKMIDIQKGTITINGIDVSKAKGKELREIRKHIGMIFQSFNLVKRSTVYQNVLSGRVGYHSSWESMFGRYSKEEKMLALRSLKKLNILDKAYVRADQLSGGQQQRVALARALTQEPNVILADEPVASLDPITTIEVMDDFKRINQTEKITIVANMHHVDLAKKYGTRIIGIKAGKVVFDGKPSEITDDVLVKIYGRSLTRNETLGDLDNGKASAK